MIGHGPWDPAVANPALRGVGQADIEPILLKGIVALFIGFILVLYGDDVDFSPHLVQHTYCN